MEAEFKQLRDELEEHRLLAQKYKQLDTQIINYKGKLGNFPFIYGKVTGNVVKKSIDGIVISCCLQFICIIDSFDLAYYFS